MNKNLVQALLLLAGSTAGLLVAPVESYSAIARSTASESHGSFQTAADSSPSAAPLARPAWASQSSSVQTVNGSYLSNYEAIQSKNLNDQIFLDAKMNRELRNDYEHQVSADESRERAGLTEASEEKTRFEAMKDLAKRAFSSISKLHAKEETRNLKRSSANTPGVREPVAAAVIAASLYNGRSVNFRLNDDIRISSRAAFKHKTASLSMYLPAGLTSTVAYEKNNAEHTTAQLSKSITDSVSAVVGSQAKGSAQLVYSVSF